MSAKTESVYTKTTTDSSEKEGVLIKGKDVIMLDAPEVLPSPETPLLTKAQDIVGAINELKKLSSGEGGDDWQPPANWLDVPEPESYGINLLVEITDNNNSNAFISITVSRPTDANTGNGPINIDWGDGSIQNWESAIDGDHSGNWSSRLSHKYSAAGQYIVKVMTTEQSCFLQILNEQIGISKILIAKLGSSIIINNDDISGNDYSTQAAFSGKSYLCWVKFSGKFTRKGTFQNCCSLQKIENLTPAEKIPTHCFENCYCLKKFDFSNVKKIETDSLLYAGFTSIDLPKCTEIAETAIQNNYYLKKINAPICTAVGTQAFSNCFNLSEAVFAEECTFGIYCFSRCYALKARPDGTTTKDYQ